MIRGYPLLLFCSIFFTLLFFMSHNFSGPRVHNVVQNVWPGDDLSTLENDLPLFMDDDVPSSAEYEVNQVHNLDSPSFQQDEVESTQETEEPVAQDEDTKLNQDTATPAEEDNEKTSTQDTADSEVSSDEDGEQQTGNSPEEIAGEDVESQKGDSSNEDSEDPTASGKQYSGSHEGEEDSKEESFKEEDSKEEDSKDEDSEDEDSKGEDSTKDDSKETPENVVATTAGLEGYQPLYSLSTADKSYFKINTGDHTMYNPNIIPNPSKNDSWIVVGQMGHEGKYSRVWSEIFCEAEFDAGELSCAKSPLTLTIPNSPEMECQPPIDEMNANIGPHDARVFWGPEFPMTTYGDNSAYTCFGQFAMDLRTLLSWPLNDEERVDERKFRTSTELQRPAPYAWLERSFFLWWDSQGDMYAHYDIQPRVFSKIDYNGSASENLSLNTSSTATDEKCLAKYVPVVKGAPEREAIQQATNSLSITLCSRTDPSCKPDESNTYTMAIFHHKTARANHRVYEPYVMLFKQDAPFTIYGISEKPLWYHGRGQAGEKDQPAKEPQRPEDESEMVYTTSISWKNSTQKHHGYLDDEMFITFGLEDWRSGAIDVLAETLIGSLGMCESHA